MSAPSFSRSKKRGSGSIRRAKLLGKTYQDAAYKPQFALGIMCRDEADQITLHDRLAGILGREVKVLVI